MKWDEAIESFLDYLDKERRVSKETLRAYKNDLYQFYRWLRTINQNSPGPADSVESLSHHNILMFFAENSFEKKTQARKLSTLRSFFSFLNYRYGVNHNPASILHLPKLGKHSPVSLEIDEVFRFLDFLCKKALKPQASWICVRNWAMYEMIYGCGVRVGEVVSLNESDVIMDEGIIKVYGKGAKERYVPVTAKAVEAVELYLSKLSLQEPVKRKVSRALFKNRFGKRLSARSIHRILQNELLECGISKKIGPHALRHSFATHMLSSGADLRSIQEMLGHSKLETTQRYTRLDIDRLSRIYDEVHPRSRKENKRE